MPSLRADAPDEVPDHETLECLLGKCNISNKETRKIKTLGQLSLEERLKTGIASLGRRNTNISGDPYAVSPVWAGNVGHPHDERMAELMTPLLAKLSEITSARNDKDDIQQLRSLLGSIQDVPIEETASRFASDGKYSVSCTNDKETVVSFQMGMHSVRVMQLGDVDKTVAESFRENARAKLSAKELSDAFREAIMPLQTQKYLMAIELGKMGKFLPEEVRTRKKQIEQLRATVQEPYWT